MTTDVQIQCIRKHDRLNPHERIKGVGGVNADGSPWYLLIDVAIKGALDKTYHFWTAGGGTSVWVEVAYHNENPYLKTVADGIQPDNLLALPECP
jgi:Protein of unknown function (DUF3892)